MTTYFSPSLPFRRSTLALGVAALTLAPAISLQARPLGNEFQVNQFTTGIQTAPAAAVDADGDYVLAWTSAGQDGSGNGVFARRYAADGSPLGNEFQVNQYTTNGQSGPAVAMDADGDFVVAWQSNGQDGYSYGVHARRYAANGNPLGPEFQVNQYTFADQGGAAIGMAADGDFVIAWSSNSQDGDSPAIVARRYDASGMAVGNEFVVNQYTTGSQQQPSVAMNAAGDVVIAWSSPQDGSSGGVYLRRFPADSNLSFSEVRVNEYTTGNQSAPVVGLDAAGNFVVAWPSTGQDGSGDGVYARRYAASGAPLSSEFRVNQSTGSSQNEVSLSVDVDGDFLLSWTSVQTVGPQQVTNNNIYGRRYAADGSPRGDEFPVSQSSFTHFNSAVAADVDGDAVIAWGSIGGQDGDGFAVVARRDGLDEPVDLVIRQFDSADPATAGAPLSYTLIAGNENWPSSATGVAEIDGAVGLVGGVRVVDVLPAGVSGVSASGSNWACSLPSGRVVCDYGLPLAAGVEAPPITVNLVAPATPGAVLGNVARVSATRPDPDLDNNRSLERTRLVCAESVIQFSAASFTVGEATANATVTVSRTGGSCGAVSVQVDSAASSAQPGLDFTDVAGTLSWADGDSANKSFTIPINNDTLDEINERFAVSLSGISGGTLGNQRTARVSITDDDASPRLNFTSSAQTVAETPALATVTARLGAISGRDVSVVLGFGGTANNGSDYFPGTTSLTIPAGQLQATADIEIAGDVIDEPDETVILSLGTASGATVGSLNSHVLTITDDDEPASLPTVSFTTASSSGDETITRSAVLQLSAASAQSITVPFSISGSATQGADYTLSRSTPITFNPGVTQIGIQTVPVDDAADEPSETVILTLGTPTGATLGATTVYTRTIADND